MKVGVSGVPWLYMDILLWRADALLTFPVDGVKSSTSKGLQAHKQKKKRLLGSVRRNFRSMERIFEKVVY